MGLKLTLIPQMDTMSGRMLAFVRLPLRTQDRDLFRKIEQIAHPFTDGVDWYSDGGLEPRDDDPYGTPLTFALASDLARCLEAADLCRTDPAVRAFINAMPPDWRVVLWWC